MRPGFSFDELQSLWNSIDERMGERVELRQAGDIDAGQFAERYGFANRERARQKMMQLAEQEPEVFECVEVMDVELHHRVKVLRMMKQPHSAANGAG